MGEHDREHAATPEPERRLPSGRGAPMAGAALQRAVGNRAMGQVLQRMETAEAVESLEKSLAAGVMGADRQVVETMTAFSADVSGFDKVSTEYEKKTETPLPPALEGRVDPPAGWYPGISEGS